MTALWLAGTLGLVVFALTGALVAARNGMDPFGFALLATVTGVGGGALRDMLLGAPVGFVAKPAPLVVCIATGVATYALGRLVPGFIPLLERRHTLLWADAAGLAIFAVTGAERALDFGAHWIAAIVLGAMTASFGGVVRDILAGERPLILHREIYVTAAFVGAATFVAGRLVLPPDVALTLAIVVGFALRALAIAFDWSLPTFSPRA
ncbi:MAG: trimeric intracellular cation channel family protein [Rhizobiales bacterium]|nr:trimeric intracellular cation channel family protein [Hyphomicrobiales bacterium]